VKKVVGDVATFTGALADSKAQIQSVLADASTLAKRLNEAGGHLDGAITDIDAVVKAVDTKKIANVMEGASGIGDVLKENKGNVDRAIKNAAELAAKLNAAADKIDGLMTTVQGFLGSGDTKGPLAEVGSAARSIRVLADDLNTRTKDISAGLTRFTGPGLREYEALAVDGRRTINDFDRVLHSLERNPSQLIFGAKPSLPEYHGGN
jgi:phospholipid/cholesterol/gamma-HCH transport system substrate-binding protein